MTSHGDSRCWSLGACFLLLAISLAGCQRQAEWGKTERRLFFRGVSAAHRIELGTFHFILPAGVERRRFALLALDALRIGSDVTIRPTDPTFYTSISSVLPPGYGAYVGSLGTLTIGERSAVGSIYSWGKSARLARGVNVAGYIKHGPGFTHEGIRPVLGTQRIADAPVEQFLLTAPQHDWGQAPSLSSDRPQNDPLVVSPGVYEKLLVEAGCTMRMTSGTYVLRELVLLDDAVLVIDNAEGPVELWVQRNLVLEGELQEQVLEPTVLLLYAGESPVTLNRGFRGTLVAPHAEVTLASTPLPHVGAFYAGKLTVESGATVKHMAFLRGMPTPMDLDAVCARCGEAAGEAERRCSAQHQIGNEAILARQMSCGDGQHCDVGIMLGDAPKMLSHAYSACVRTAQHAFTRCLLQEHWRPGVCRQFLF